MQVTIGLRRKSGMHAATMLIVGQIPGDKLADEV